MEEEQEKKRKSNILLALPLLLNKQQVPCDNILTDSNGEMYLENFPIPVQPDLLGGVCPTSREVNNKSHFLCSSLHPLNPREISC